MATFDVVAGIAAVIGACAALVAATGVLVVNGKQACWWSTARWTGSPVAWTN